MDIIFNKEPGNIYDFFNTLWVLNNYEYSKEISKDLRVDKDSEFDKHIEVVFATDTFNRCKVEKYFPKELEANILLNIEEVWKYENLDEYITHLSTLDNDEVKENLVRIINKVLGEHEDPYKNIDKGNTANEILEYIEDKEINSKIKWEIFCILRDSKGYIQRFVDDIQDYLEVYKNLMKKRGEELKKFNREIEESIDKEGVKFLKDATNNALDFQSFENIYVTTSIDIGLYIKSFHEKKSCYVVIGPRMKEILKNMGGEGELEKNMAIFKNYSDEVKFSILRLLMEGEYYALEIGERLGLSKVNVSRNVKHLMLAGLISVKKVGQKTYYSLNKNVMADNVKFIIDQFNLYEEM